MILISYIEVGYSIFSHHFIVEKQLNQSKIQIGAYNTIFIFENVKFNSPYYVASKLFFANLNTPNYQSVNSVYHFNSLLRSTNNKCS